MQPACLPDLCTSLFRPHRTHAQRAPTCAHAALAGAAPAAGRAVGLGRCQTALPCGPVARATTLLALVVGWAGDAHAHVCVGWRWVWRFVGVSAHANFQSKRLHDSRHSSCLGCWLRSRGMQPACIVNLYPYLELQPAQAPCAGPPLQTPPWQERPPLQAVLSGLGVPAPHVPTAGLHVPAALSHSRRGQVTPTQGPAASGSRGSIAHGDSLYPLTRGHTPALGQASCIAANALRAWFESFGFTRNTSTQPFTSTSSANGICTPCGVPDSPRPTQQVVFLPPAALAYLLVTSRPPQPPAPQSLDASLHAALAARGWRRVRGGEAWEGLEPLSADGERRTENAATAGLGYER